MTPRKKIEASPRSASRRSAGLLMFRHGAGTIEVFVVHPGGPFFARKDEGAWSIPKGEVESGEDPLTVAQREFAEETGQRVQACGRESFVPLGSIQQRGGKVVEGWAFEGNWPSQAVLESNTFSIEWPPGSGQMREFPEVDRGEFFSIAEARKKINSAQAEFLDRLLEALKASD